MPYYEFECPCGEVTEELVSMGTENINCPKCGHSAKKIMSLCAFSLKGSGWYADGYASKGGAKKTESKASTSDTAAKTDSGSGSTTKAKSDSK